MAKDTAYLRRAKISEGEVEDLRAELAAPRQAAQPATRADLTQVGAQPAGRIEAEQRLAVALKMVKDFSNFIVCWGMFGEEEAQEAINQAITFDERIEKALSDMDAPTVPDGEPLAGYLMFDKRGEFLSLLPRDITDDERAAGFSSLPLLRKNAHPSDLREAAPDALGYATRLAEALMAKHYPEASQWRVLPDLLGVLTQIDNMTTGLVRSASPPPDHASGKQEAFDRMLDGCIAFLMERGHRDLAAEMRARIIEHPEVQPDHVAAAREAVWASAMAAWRRGDPIKGTLGEACAALAALEKGEG